MSLFAATNLSPAFPDRAAWGTATKLRAWQAEALDRYLSSHPRDFLAVATPGAGKTTFALRIAAELLASGTVTNITVVAPTEHLKVQWAEAAARVGIQIRPDFANSSGQISREFHGVALTYAGVASRPDLHRSRTASAPTLVILDEIHHGGDALTWGDAITEAFGGATRRLALTGTPFRSDTAPIPFVHYEPDADGVPRSTSDFSYGYAEALRDGVVRPVMFMTYGGSMRWRTSAGEELAARLGEPMTKDMMAHAWKTALSPKGDWIPAVLRAADQRLSQVREHVPDAGALVIATDQTMARAYASLLHEITGRKPVVVLSDDAGASARIEEFAGSDDRWMVAVRMVSEGVDVPRLCVGVYATSTSTPLFFAQAVGRFVRARKRGETATVFLPSVPVLLEHASSLEQVRDHVLAKPRGEEEFPYGPEEQLMLAANSEVDASSALLEENRFQALESAAEFDHVLFDAQQFGTNAVAGSEEEQEFLGLPGLLEPDQVAHVLRARAQQQGKNVPAAAPARSLHRAVKDLRIELNTLVGAYAKKTGSPHAVIHTRLRGACGGPAVEAATQDQVSARIEVIRKWMVGRT